MHLKQHKTYDISKQSIAASQNLVKLSQKLKVLLWKMYILRKRHWIITLLEIIVPIIVFWLVIHFKNMLPEEGKIVYNTNPGRYNQLVIQGTYKIAYTPSNTFTDTVMKSATAKLLSFGCQVMLVSRNNEEEVTDWLKQEFTTDTKNKTRDFTFYSISPKGVGVMFLNAESTSQLTYVLRTTRGGLDTSENSLYGEQNGYSLYAYDFSGFTTVQAAIDQAYLLNLYNTEVKNTTFVGELPFIEYMVVNLVDMLLPTIVSLGFAFVMPSLLREIVEEKTSGIKEMMTIMGLRPWLNWVNWVVYSLIVYFPVTLVVTGLLTIDSGSGQSVHADFFLVWFMFMLYILAFVTLIFATSTFFTNGTIAMISGEIAWYGTTILLDTFIVRLPDKYGLFLNLLTCLWPSISLVWGLNTINNFKKNGHAWTLSSLFDDGAGGGRVSVGLAAIMLCVDIVVYSVITWYMDNVRPGPYGRAKPLTFIFPKRCKKKAVESISSRVTNSQQNYEPPPKNVKVGIRIENLRKTFNRGKVEAVKNVDLDIYEGKITALLGHNGAGKSTTMSILSGFFSPTSGKVIVRGRNIFNNMDEFRSSLGLCPQHNLLFSFFTVLEHLLLFGMLKGLSKKQSEREGKMLLKSLLIYGKKNVLVSKLSGGMKRKLCLAIALMGDPQVLMLDEPTSGLDPESRRQVWDMLLSTRGQRTTIITTHFMEEADVLGDRIAIMDHGQVSCYGTAMYLKKLYGAGYHLNVSKIEVAPVPPITAFVHRFVENATLTVSSPMHLSYNMKSSEMDQFSELFASLETWKSQLGLTGMGLMCSTMEDVFLKVAEEPEGTDTSNSNVEIGYFGSKVTKESGRGLYSLQFRALVYKKVLIKLKSWISTLIFIAVPIILMAASMMKVMEQDYKSVQPNLKITLASFPKVHVAVSSSKPEYSSALKDIVGSDATYESIPNDTTLNNYMTEKIDYSLVQYERQMITGFEINSTHITGAYSRYFFHSLPVILNMMANILLKQVSQSSSITVYNHPIPVKLSQDVCDLSMSSGIHVFNFPLHMIFLSMGLLILTMSFISFPLKERVSSAKQLQLMTGVSPLLYWTTTYLCDAVVYVVTAALMVSMLFIFQRDEILTASGYAGTLVLVFVLFGISGIPFAYLFSFLVKSSVKASVIFVLINMISGTLGAAFLVILDGSYTNYGVWRFFLGFNPLFSATSAFIHLITTMYIDGTCLQCGRNCTTQDPLQFLESGPNTQYPHGINSFLLFLVADMFIYWSIILIIEYGLLKKFVFLISTLWIKMDNLNFEGDSDVVIEKERVLSSQKLKVTSGNETGAPVLLVNDLGKKYNRKTTAVKGITFQVGEGECFGLLGVNGAGKSTTFKMLTGEEIPNKGDASILQLSLLREKSRFLGNVGYCPQFDAINKTLTGREMLYIYALLRGVPSAYCHSEVSRWIGIMGLKEYAGRPCGTYSGGNKRKLSTAMAFIGEPPVVLLDEPTTGVDPVSRRKLWDVVARCQRAGQAIVLTSHSMEECEALCSRLTIMVAGQMKCIGSPQYLKQRFGQGYTIKVNLHTSPELLDTLFRLKFDMNTQFFNCSIKDEHLGLLHYHIPDPSIPLSDLFAKMEHLKRRHKVIEDYIVTDTSLEEVFMSFARAVTHKVK